MRSKFLAGAAALALTAVVVIGSSAPASARWYRGWGPGAAVGLAAGAVLGGVAAATSPLWGGYYYNPYPGYADPGYNYYAYQPGYDWGYSAPAWGYAQSTDGYVPPGWGGAYRYNYTSPAWNGAYGAVAPARDQAYCERRYRSYDPASGTFLGYDGLRHSCP